VRRLRLRFVVAGGLLAAVGALPLAAGACGKKPADPSKAAVTVEQKADFQQKAKMLEKGMTNMPGKNPSPGG